MCDSFSSDDRHRPETSDFLCGVVEGFYGRPWSYPQRRELFRRMQSMGMNSYLYAPKDDLKHRHAWREQYTEKEEEHMRSLIAAAVEHNILFIFAISPGSDVVYSQDNDVSLLKAKLQQATRLGCRAFALLFDDIDTRLSPADRDVFGCPGRAQVALANKIYDSLNQPDTFLFCPTEYCASRAVPNVSNSTYLATLGNDLASGIKVLWTGPIVVSKRIPTLGIRDLARLLKRPIVLWDNLHANDYDQRRIFLGPYSGRPLALRRRRLIHGVLTNPNCEFEANYVALHTLAQWARLAEPVYADNVLVSEDLADIGDDLEKEMAESQERWDEQTCSDNNTIANEVQTESNTMATCSESNDQKNAPIYRPRKALYNALRDWLSLMLQDQRLATVSKIVSSIPSPIPMETDTIDNSETIMQIESSSPMSTDQKLPISDITLSTGEPTDVLPTLGVSLDDLVFLSDLFYLPFTHGPSSLRILELGYWLRDNSHLAPYEGCASDCKDNEWCQKYTELFQLITRVSQLREKVQRLPHPGVVYDLAPYLTEINAVLTMVLDYFRWMESGVMANRNHAHLKRLLTWFSPGYSEMTMSGEHEPWVFRGGLITEIQRILPLESAQDLFPAPSRVGPSMTTTPAGVPVSANGFPSSIAIPLVVAPPLLPHRFSILPPLQPRRPYLVRPFRVEDKSLLYDLWRRLVLRRLGLPTDSLPVEYHDLPGDRYLLAYLEHSPQHCLIVEGPPLYFQPVATDTITDMSTKEDGEMEAGEERSIVGFACAAPDVSAWARDREELCRSRLREKYPKVDKQQHRAVETLLLKKPGVVGTPSLSVEDFISLSIEWFYNDRMAKISSVITEASVIDEPPEPLGAAIGDQPMVIENPGSPAQTGQMVEEPKMNAGQDVRKATPTKPCVPTVSLKESSASSVPSTSSTNINLQEEEVKKLPLTAMDSTSTVSVLSQWSFGRVPVMEAIHSALMAHPASILVELDDSHFPLPSATPLALITEQHRQISFDPTPELVLDEVAHRLFVCLLAGLKTCASQGVHVELDTINESRADLYRRFGFYPVAAASTDFITVLGRLI